MFWIVIIAANLAFLAAVPEAAPGIAVTTAVGIVAWLQEINF